MRVTMAWSCDDELACDIERVHAELRRGDVRGLLPWTRMGNGRPRVVDPRLEPTVPAGRSDAVCSPNDALCAIQQGRGDERPCALTDFLCGLKEKRTSPPKPRGVRTGSSPRREDRSRARRGRRRASCRRLRAVGHVVRLLNGKASISARSTTRPLPLPLPVNGRATPVSPTRCAGCRTCQARSSMRCGSVEFVQARARGAVKFPPEETR